MFKKIIKFFLYFLIILLLCILYLGFFGIETKRFNQLIKNEISKRNQKIDIDLKDVKIILNLRNFFVSLETYNSELIFGVQQVKLKKLKTNFSINSFIFSWTWFCCLMCSSALLRQ